MPDSRLLLISAAALGMSWAGMAAQAGDGVRLNLTPHYSDALGFSLRAAGGFQLSSDSALGVIIDYGDHKREYLGNLGLDLGDGLSFIGTLGQLEERTPERVRQMEYGFALRKGYDLGALESLEINGYLVDANAENKDTETARLHGLQLAAGVHPFDSLQLKFAAGHEWLEWNAQDRQRGFTYAAEATQYLGDSLSLRARVKMGQSERLYGGGLNIDLSSTGTNMLGLDYAFIAGQSGIEGDKRVMLSWTLGFGGSNQATPGMVAPEMPGGATSLLEDVMLRPAYLPARVLARTGGCDLTQYASVPASEYLELLWNGTFPAGYTSSADFKYNPTTIRYAGNIALGRLEANATPNALVNMQNDGGISVLRLSDFTGPITLEVTLNTGVICIGTFPHP